MRIYAIYDLVAEEITLTFGARNRTSAIRMFTDTLANPQSPLAKHPADFNLLEVAQLTFNGALIIPDGATGFSEQARAAFPAAISTSPPALVLTGADWQSNQGPRLTKEA